MVALCCSWKNAGSKHFLFWRGSKVAPSFNLTQRQLLIQQRLFLLHHVYTHSEIWRAFLREKLWRVLPQDVLFGDLRPIPAKLEISYVFAVIYFQRADFSRKVRTTFCAENYLRALKYCEQWHCWKKKHETGWRIICVSGQKSGKEGGEWEEALVMKERLSVFIRCERWEQ